MSTELAHLDARELAARIAPLFLRAQKLYAKILAGEKGMLKRRDALCWRSWQLGKVLTEMKEEIGHSRWLFWLGGNWPDLGVRSAQRCMLLWKENPNAQNFAYLTSDSMRKFMFGYVPVKERPELAGNGKIAPHVHQLTFVNQFLKWDRQATVGLVTRPSVEVLRHDLEPVVKRIAELAGPDWMKSLLGDAVLG